MDFFGAQDQARRRSRWLLLAFAAAVAVVVLAVYAVAHVTLGPGLGRPVDPRLFALVASVTSGAILLVSWWRARQLRQGGHVVATLLGGRRVQPHTQREHERRLFNVVEEMSIAAGIPVPGVFILDRESGINAFAAGLTPADAVVAVTGGALLRLDRDELQAMVAHEVAHILNGDMRVNTRLVGLLYGILLPGVVGRGMLASRLSAAAPAGKPAWMVAGALLVVVGELGVVLGRIIQAAVSRQRELLADAAAVQFTRDPAALAGVLRKIGGLAFGSRVTHSHAAEVAHLFLGEGLGPPLLLPLETHPPLVDRIRRLDPSFDGTFEATRTPTRPRLIDQVAVSSQGPARADLARLGMAAIIASIGEPGAGHVDHAARFLAGLPTELRNAAHHPDGARALLLALLLAEGAAAEQGGVADAYDARIAAHARRLAPLARAQGATARVPLLELTLPALQALPAGEGRRFRRAALQVIRASGRARIFDLAVMRVLARRLAGHTPAGAAGPGGIPSLGPLRDEVGVLLSAVARAGGGSDQVVAARFDAAGRMLPRQLELALVPPAGTTLAAVDAALLRLELAAPVLRRRVLEACMGSILSDGRLDAEELELIRATAEALDLPLPPILMAGGLPTGSHVTPLPA